MLVVVRCCRPGSLEGTENLIATDGTGVNPVTLHPQPYAGSRPKSFRTGGALNETTLQPAHFCLALLEPYSRDGDETLGVKIVSGLGNGLRSHIGMGELLKPRKKKS